MVAFNYDRSHQVFLNWERLKTFAFHSHQHHKHHFQLNTKLILLF